MSTESRHYEIQRLYNGAWIRTGQRYVTLEQARRERMRIHETPEVNHPAYPYRVVAIERRVIWMETEWDTIPAERDYSERDE